jgi:hypothetical protein
MDLSHILIGLVFAFIFWKLLKLTIKTFLWLALIGLVVAFFVPGQLPLIGDIGGVILSFLGTLLVLTVAGFFFFEGD